MSQLLIHNAYLYDPASNRGHRGALLIEEGRIAKVFSSEDELPTDYPTYDAGSAFLMPAFFDAHVHLIFGGESLGHVNCHHFASKDDLLQEIRHRASTIQASPQDRRGWLLGFGLQPSQLSPTLAELDEAAGSVPLRLDTHDLHSCQVNTAALQQANLNRATPDPQGGYLERDADGSLTGFLRENAAYLMRPIVPALKEPELEDVILRAQTHAHSLGITGVSENLSRLSEPIFRRLEAEGKLKLRIQAWRNDGNLVADTADLPRWQSPLMHVDTMKFFADGALGSLSAAMKTPYIDGTKGDLVASPDALRKGLRQALEKGWRLAVHAIGDAAVAQVLDFFEEFKAEGFDMGGYKHRIEHAQFVDPVDLDRFKELEVIPGIQPLHAASDQDIFAGRLTPQQIERAFPWRSFHERGCPLPIGTDWPVEALDPRANLDTAQSRRSLGGRQLIGQKETLPLDVLLRGMTEVAASVAGFSDLGHLRVGAHADFVLLGENPFDIDAAACRQLPILATFHAGDVVFLAS